MGILRADIISHSQLSDGNASVLFDGTTDSLTIPSHSAFAFGTGDWTVEGWFYFTDLVGDGNGQQTLVGDTYGDTAGWYLYKQTTHKLGVYYASSPTVSGNATIVADRWYHLAFVRHSGITRIYIDGELDAEGADTTNATITQYYIGDTADSSSGEFFGNISNLRITRTAVYKDNFTVPKFKLKEIPGTILLCCQSSSSTTETTVSVPGTLTANGNPTATNFGPGLKEDITDTGVVFDGFGSFATSTYMVPPSGKTTERNRGRAIMAGGMKYPTANAEIIEMLEIQSGGQTQDFGDLITATSTSGPVSSSTRGVFVAGLDPSGRTNVIEFVTIATTGNATNFGDYVEAISYVGGVSNETRGVTASGNGPSSPTNSNTMAFVTIASTGDAQNFGDLSQRSAGVMGVQSSTRGVFNIGSLHDGSYGFTNAIEFITIASTGDATDFGDLTRTNSAYGGSCCSSTRGLFAGGYNNTPAPVTEVNNIDYITIASTGNSLDFGDLVTAGFYNFGTSNKTRGIFQGRLTTAPTSGDPMIDSVTIASTGNAVVWGEMYRMDSGPHDGQSLVRRGATTISDSHGGL